MCRISYTSSGTTKEIMDIERLRQKLIDYYGTLAQVFPPAYLEIDKIKNMSPEEVIATAQEVLGESNIKRR